MPLLNFKPIFVQPIRDGTKAHTIRADRKHPIKVGDTLHLYCGLRRKGAYRILPKPVTCTKVQAIQIHICPLCNGDGERCCSSTHYESCHTHEIIVDEILLSRDEREQLARCDGFDDFSKMMAFWEGRLPFKGQIIHWRVAQNKRIA